MIIQDNYTIEIFKNQLPVKPYCSNNLENGLSIRTKIERLRCFTFKQISQLYRRAYRSISMKTTLSTSSMR